MADFLGGEKLEGLPDQVALRLAGGLFEKRPALGLEPSGDAERFEDIGFVVRLAHRCLSAAGWPAAPPGRAAAG
ncbi:MAG TPA: hypothetical protein PKW75_06025 [candidate division Zixibacteria bacterium]|nr:hypothetical protein [candidate division Zixibacteria bacterium]